MTGVSGLYGGADMAKVMFGQNAVHVPCWMYVQDHGPGTVGLVGASMTTGQVNPLTYGAGHYDRDRYPGPQQAGYRSIHFVVGEVIVRPHLVIATDALDGDGASALYTGNHDVERMLSDGELVIGSDLLLQKVYDRYERGAWRH